MQCVVVLGSQQQIDETLFERNLTPRYVGGYRVTDRDTLKVAIEAAGHTRTASEMYLSKVRCCAVRGGGVHAVLRGTARRGNVA